VLVRKLPNQKAPQDCVVRPERSEVEGHAKASHKHELEFRTNFVLEKIFYYHQFNKIFKLNLLCLLK